MTDEMRDLQAEVDQLTAELAEQTARANALDSRAAAAERLAREVVAAVETGQVLTHRGSGLTNAIELWHRMDGMPHPVRARDYSDAVLQAAAVSRERSDEPHPAGFTTAQLHRLADAYRERFPYPDPRQNPPDYVTNRAMHTMADALDELAGKRPEKHLQK